MRANLDRQRANTKEEDPTGLVCGGFRYRELETGVWMSKDPAGFADGPNLYAYVRQNPWSKFGPLGLAEESETDKTTPGTVPLFNGTYFQIGGTQR
jgi:RHS repeat-associated protein